jgi:hypothetical protein
MSSKALLAGLILLTASPAIAYDLSKDWTRDFSKDADRTVGSSVRSEERTPPRAPAGHRQPRASDLPANRLPNSSDEWLAGVNHDINRKLQICRGC